MAIPEFILSLREKIGHDQLWLPSVTGLVLDDDGRILLVRRRDNRRWTLVTGILEPGEEPAAGMLREIQEETAVRARVERFLGVAVSGPVTFPNGDHSVFLDTVWLCRAVGGEARVNDDESVDVGWYALDDMPALPERQDAILKRYLAGGEGTWFVPADVPAVVPAEAAAVVTAAARPRRAADGA